MTQFNGTWLKGILHWGCGLTNRLHTCQSNAGALYTIMLDAADCEENIKFHFRFSVLINTCTATIICTHFVTKTPTEQHKHIK